MTTLFKCVAAAAFVSAALGCAACSSNDAQSPQPGSGGSAGAATGTGGAGSPSSSAGQATNQGGQANPSAAVTVTPAVAHVGPGVMQQFSAMVKDGSAVTWSVEEGAAAGTITDKGLYTAPDAAGTYHVVASTKTDKGTATVVVAKPGDCSNLPAAGVWENVSPLVTPPGESSGHNFSESIVVDPFDPATVWWGSGYGGIFKSTDCGSTWKKINTGMDADKIDGSAAGSMQVDPLNQGVMYTTAFQGANGLFKSVNGGVDWKQLAPPGSTIAEAVDGNIVNSIAMEAANPKHLVIAMHAQCKPPYGPICEAESTDGGETWTVTTVPTALKGGYAAGAGAFIINETTWLFGAYTDGLWLTKDRGKTFTNVTPKGTGGSTAGKTLVLPFTPNPADGKFYLPSMDGIIQSTGPDGESWTLLPNSGGRSVGFVIGGDGKMYSADQWSTGYHVASQQDPSKWDVIPPPKDLPEGQGAPYLALDATHHVLYSSNFAAGLWRVVVP